MPEQERKYFDSGDYALSKAGKASDVGVTQIGSKHPLPENIPHSHINTSGSTTSSSTASPAKESPLLHVLKNSLAQDSEGAAAEDSATPDSEGAQASPTNTSSVPARWQASSPDS